MVEFFTGIWNDFVGVFAGAIQSIAEFYGFLGGHKWAAAIVTLTLIVRSLLIPLVVKQVKSMRAMQRLQPEMKRLQQKYKKDRQRLNQELMDLYKREGVNPLGSCLPIGAQAPVFIAMYWSLRHITEDLGVGSMPFLGIADLAVPARASVGGWILLIVMAVTSVVSMRQMSSAQSPQQQKIMQLLPIFFVFVLMNFPAALVLYWMTQNIFQFVQQTIMLRRHPIPTQDQKGAEAKDKQAKDKQAKPVKPSQAPKGPKAAAKGPAKAGAKGGNSKPAKGPKALVTNNGKGRGQPAKPKRKR